MKLTFKQFLSESSEYKMDTLKKNKKSLSDEERNEAMKAGAVWHHGPGGTESCAIWKAVIDGKDVFVTNTHRAVATALTLKDAVNKFHSFIKKTS